MINFKKISLTLMIGPVLFVGCVSEKTASIKPLVLERKIVQLENNQTPQPEPKEKKIVQLEDNIILSNTEKLLTSAIFGGIISLNDTENETPIISNQELIAPTLQVNNHFEVLAKEDEILETAKKFLGVKYIWAANGPSAFDCSGFTKYVFKKSGITLPRYSGHQANMGEKIKFENLEKGDLVFFDTTKKFRKKVNHVGIFMGNNKFIHASSGGKRVMITSFSKKKFYKNKFLYARRILNMNESFALNTISKNNSIN